MPVALVPRPATAPLLVALAALAWLVAPADGLTLHARLVVLVFAGAVYAWSATGADDTRVALVAAGAVVALGGDLGVAGDAALDATVWLLLGAFVVAAVAEATGLAAHLARTVTARARSVQGLCWRLTAALVATAFVIPATSGRAALMVPVFAALAPAVGPAAARALALLIPTVILLSAIASLTGAGAHLVTAGALEAAGHGGIGFAAWVLYGLPFALVSSFGAAWVVQRLFLTRQERRRAVALDLAPAPLSAPARRTLRLVVGLVVLWATEPVHGVGPTAVALAGAAAAPFVAGVAPSAALRRVQWRLLAFLAATLVLGHALVETGAADWFVAVGLARFGGLPAGAVLVAIIALSLAAHLVITSRTARSSVIVPAVIVVAAATGLDPAVAAFASTAAAGFCLTLPVSAKPVLLFSALDRPTFAPADLLRLSKVLAPAHLLLLVLFAVAVWPALGLGGAPQ